MEKTSVKILSKSRVITLLLSLLALSGCLVYTWMTQDTLAQLSFMRRQNQHNGTGHNALISIETWQTANTLQPMAVTAEEQEYALHAEQLADHEVDQAFASALRLTSTRAHRMTLTGDAQNFAQTVAELEQLVRQDRQQVHQLFGNSLASETTEKTPDSVPDNDNLELARTQLALDSGELADARKQLAHLAGDNTDKIQRELNAYHQAQQQAQNSNHPEAARAVASAQQRHTLLMRLQSWQHQFERTQLLKQAAAQAASEATALVAERATTQNLLNGMVAASTATQNRLELLQDKSSRRQILSIYDDRIETDRQLSEVYNKWIAQVAVQHRILLHMIMVSLAWILFLFLVMIVADMLVQSLLEHPRIDNRQVRTLRRIIRIGLQILGAIMILLIIFGVPQQTSTALGLTTAALTIALQDFVLAFFGWFLLMGRNGIHVGDWVEINGVNGEVVDIGVFNTTLIELGSLTGKGHPTGRRISFINSFAIRGQYFNFSTAGQWMWDSVSIGIPKTLDVHQVAAEIEQLVHEKTEEDAHTAEQDWSRVARGSSLANLAATSTVSMSPTVEGIEVTVHYITRATNRFATRDRLYLQLLSLLQSRQNANANLPAKNA